MNKGQQDLAFACLPKEARNNILSDYEYYLKRYEAVKSNTSKGAIDALEDIFGRHNLTSDKEPSEIICVNKERFDNFYKLLEHCYNHDSTLYDDLYWKFVECLPDKEPSRLCDKCANESYGSCKINIGCDGASMFTDDRESCDDYKPKEQQSVQDEPKYKPNDEVHLLMGGDYKHKDVILDIVGQENGEWVYHLKNSFGGYAEHNLAPYTEPETKDNNNMEIMEEYHPKLHPLTGEPMPNEKVEEIADRIAKNVYDNVTKQLKDNMEEKELNFCELLKGCEGEEFYSPTFGDVIFRRIDGGNNRVFISYVGIGKSDSGYYIESKGNISLYGDCILFPSRALYEKYPLDAYSAWMEWKSERTPKRWRAKKGENYWYMYLDMQVYKCIEEFDDTDQNRYNNGNYFRTKEEAQQAIEVVRECLEKFHEQCCPQL